MIPPPDSPLSIEAIRAHLTTRTIGVTISVHGEVDSTNRVAADLWSHGAPNGTIVIAESQTKGRGRLGRRWISPPGVNLYLSIVLTHITPSASSWIPLTGAVAVARAINGLTKLQTKLKWPNDVLIADRKIAGVLAETLGHSDGDNAIVVGMGLNVNMSPDHIPEELRPIATSILIETGRPADRVALLGGLCSTFETLFHDLDHHRTAIMQAYRELCVTLGKQVRVEMTGRECAEGTAEDIAPDGALRLRGSDGKMLEIRAGDVVHLG